MSRDEIEPGTTPSLRDTGEDGLLALLCGRLGAQTAGLPLGTGDDVAITSPCATRMVWTIDSMIEGTHFRFWPGVGADRIGAKLAATNLSDLASKGAAPRFALLSLGVPAEARVAAIEAFVSGLCARLGADGARLIGGDTVRAPQWTLTLALAGELEDGLPIASRSRARPGQRLYVTGTLGDSAAGLRLLESSGKVSGREHLIERHLAPPARVTEGRALVGVFGDLAMMDVSDGLLRDGSRLAAASGVRLVVHSTGLPLSPELLGYCRDECLDAVRFALEGGEDYELLFATSAEPLAVREAMRAAGCGTGVTPIGRVEEGTGLALCHSDGRLEALAVSGFEHFQ